MTVIFLCDSPFNDYRQGQSGTIVGFVSNDGEPLAVVCKRTDDKFVAVPLTHIRRIN